MIPFRSLPAREVWIGIRRGGLCGIPQPSLPAREVWIEINRKRRRVGRLPGHFPQGKCGLKC